MGIIKQRNVNIYKGIVLHILFLLLATNINAEENNTFNFNDIPGNELRNSEVDKAVVSHDFVRALQAVMQYNPALKSKQAEVNSYQFNVESAKARRYPTLSLQADNLDEYDEGILSLDQPLWAFGKIDAAIDEASATYTAQQWALKIAQRELIIQTAQIYNAIQANKLQLVVAKQNIKEHESLYERVSRREKGQLSSNADTRLAYSRLLQSKAILQRLLSEKAIAENKLQTLTQTTVSTNDLLDTAFFSLPASNMVTKFAINRSADVGFKREQLNVVRLNVEQEEVAILPTISLRVERDLFDDINDEKETRVGIVFESDLEGLGFVNAGRVSGAQARLSAAEEDLNSSINDVREQVNSLLINRQLKQDLVESEKATVAAVEETMQSFLRQYNSGRKSWLDVLNTQRELTELRLQLVQTDSDWQELSLRILTMIGYLDIPAGLESLNE